MRISPGSSTIAVRRASPYFVLDLAQLVDDDLHQQPPAAEDRPQPLDLLHQRRELVDDLLPLEAGQALELHVEDRLRLDLRQTELAHQAVARERSGSTRRESA